MSAPEWGSARVELFDAGADRRTTVGRVSSAAAGTARRRWRSPTRAGASRGSWASICARSATGRRGEIIGEATLAAARPPACAGRRHPYRRAAHDVRQRRRLLRGARGAARRLGRLDEPHAHGHAAASRRARCGCAATVLRAGKVGDRDRRARHRLRCAPARSSPTRCSPPRCWSPRAVRRSGRGPRTCRRRRPPARCPSLVEWLGVRDVAGAPAGVVELDVADARAQPVGDRARRCRPRRSSTSRPNAAAVAAAARRRTPVVHRRRRAALPLAVARRARARVGTSSSVNAPTASCLRVEVRDMGLDRVAAHTVATVRPRPSA